MKLNFIKVMLFTCMLAILSPATMAAKFNAESMGRTFTVIKVDAKKKIIYLDNKEISYNDKTKIYDANGNVVSADVLRKGFPMAFYFDAAKRYLNRPVATAIRIKTAVPLVR